eukprot:1006821-Prymnesium_polylepis.1
MDGYETRWCSVDAREPTAEWTWCGGPPLSYFQAEYAYAHELLPPRRIRWCARAQPLPFVRWRVRAADCDCAVTSVARLLAAGCGDSVASRCHSALALSRTRLQTTDW